MLENEVIDTVLLGVIQKLIDKSIFHHEFERFRLFKSIHETTQCILDTLFRSFLWVYYDHKETTLNNQLF